MTVRDYFAELADRAIDPTRPCLRCWATGRLVKSGAIERVATGAVRVTARTFCPTCNGSGLMGRYPDCRCRTACKRSTPSNRLCAPARAWREAVVARVMEGQTGTTDGEAWAAVAQLLRSKAFGVGAYPLDAYKLTVEVTYEAGKVEPYGLDELLGQFSVTSATGREVGAAEGLGAAVLLVVRDMATPPAGGGWGGRRAGSSQETGQSTEGES